MIEKTIDFCEKLENDLSDVPLFFSFFHGKNFFGGEEEKISRKNKGGWRASTHKNKHEMESIQPHNLTHFPT